MCPRIVGIHLAPLEELTAVIAEAQAQKTVAFVL